MFDLTKQRSIQSFILKGNEFTQLVIDLTVSNFDPLVTKYDDVYIILINLSELDALFDEIKAAKNQQQLKEQFMKFVEYKTVLKRHHFVVVPEFTSDIYELLILKEKKGGNEKFTDVRVILNIDIQPEPTKLSQALRVKNEIQHLTPTQEEQMVSNMKRLAEQNEVMFLDSLQLWEKIQQHRKQQQAAFQWNESIQLWECAGIALMYVTEYFVFRTVTTKKVLV